nr:tyrosine-type recombinase/integrase [Streptomyces coryli]
MRSVRKHGETKTRKSRRTIALPKQVVDVLEAHKRLQKQERASKGKAWSPTGRVFTTRSGEPLDAANVRRDFKAIAKKAGLEPEWTPRELRHSFVSLLSDHGIPLERIAQLVGHTSQATDRGGLPQAAPAGHHAGSGGHGRDLRQAKRGACRRGLTKFLWPPVWPPERKSGPVLISQYWA